MGLFAGGAYHGVVIPIEFAIVGIAGHGRFGFQLSGDHTGRPAIMYILPVLRITSAKA